MKRGFKTQRAAELWLADLENSKTSGTFVQEKRKATKLNEFIDEYFQIYKTRVHPSTFNDAFTVWVKYIQPRWGDVSLGDFSTGDIELWISQIPKSPTLARREHYVLKGSLNYAVKQRWLPVNPAIEFALPKKDVPERRYLTNRELQAVIASTPEHYRTLIMLPGYEDLRWGEAVALLVKDVDGSKINATKTFKRGNGQWHVNPPKNGKTRVAVVPGFVASSLDRQAEGKRLNDLLFPRKDGTGYMWQTSRVPVGSRKRSWWEQTLLDAGVEYLRIHDLRHTAASLAIHAGANVKVVQHMLGHASVAMTLDVYADLFYEDLYDVAGVMDRAYGGDFRGV